MIVASRLRRLGKHPNRRRITTNIGQRQCNAEFHRALPKKHPSPSGTILSENELSP